MGNRFRVKLARFLAMCMGSSGSDASSLKSKAIDKQIRSDEKKMAREVKLLLLGKHSRRASFLI